MDMEDIEVGETYLVDELPDNDMNSSGALEWVGEDTYILSREDGLYVEFGMAVVCRGIGQVDLSDGTIETVEGELS